MKSRIAEIILLTCLIIFTSACKKDFEPMESGPINCFLTEEEKDVVEELKSNYAHSFLSADPEVSESLSALTSYLSSTKIVGLGEATHGTKEFFQFKDKLFRQLVLEEDFNAVIFEIPWGNAFVVNEFVTRGIGTADEAMDQTYYWVYDTQETRDLANWMRAYNLSLENSNPSEQIHFVGCDPQGGGFEVEKNMVYKYLEKVAPPFVDTAYQKYASLPYNDLTIYPDLDPAVRNKNREGTKYMYEFINSNREGFVASTGLYEYEVARMASHVIQHRDMMYRTQSFSQTRDSLMAIYALWWQEILAPDAKVATWAHNLHVMDNPVVNSKWMGDYLRDSLSTHYKNLAFSFSKGGLNAFYANGQGKFQSSVRKQTVQDYQCGTLNNLLSQVATNPYYLIFDEIVWPRISHLYLDQSLHFYQIGAGFNYMHMHNYTNNLEVFRSWDVLVHFDQVEASELR